MSLVVTKFSALWCPPCKLLAPIFEKVEQIFNDVEFRVVDIDDQPELASQMKVTAVPTIIFQKDGKVVETLVGLQKEGTLVETVMRLK